MSGRLRLPVPRTLTLLLVSAAWLALGPLVLLLAAAALLVPRVRRWLRPTRRVVVGWSLAAVAVVGVVVVVPDGRLPIPPGAGLLVVVAFVALNLGLMDFILGIFGKDSTLTGRTYLWEQGWNAAQKSPILGVGYAAYWVQGFAEAERLWNEFYITTRTGFHFHNTYIEALVELGFVGVALISLIMLRTLYGHVSAVIFRTWQADSVILIGVLVLLLIRGEVRLR